MGLLLFIMGLGMFLEGIDLSTRSFRKVLGKGLDHAFTLPGANRGFSFLFGLALSSLSHSSTAATSFTVGLVDLGLIPLESSILVIMGASVGSSLVTLLLSLELIRWSPLVLLTGWLLSKKAERKYSQVGKLLAGIGILLSGMVLIKTGILPLFKQPELKTMLLLASRNPITLAFFSFALTSLTQSSPMVMALAIALSTTGIIGIPSILWIVIGSHLGNSGIVLLSGAGKGINARRLAWGNLFFRLTGCLCLIPFYSLIISFISETGLPLPNLVALLHIGVATFNVILFLPFITWFSAFLKKVMKPSTLEQLGTPLFLSDSVKQFPSMALDLLAKEMVRTGNNLEEILYRLFQSKPDFNRIESLSRGSEELLNSCVSFLSDIAAPGPGDFWKKEYSTISYSLAALRNLSETLNRKLYPLMKVSGCELLDQFAENDDYLRMTAFLSDLVSTAVGSFALGGTELAQRSEKIWIQYLDSESSLRDELMQRGLWLNSKHDVYLWDFVTYCNLIAEAAFEMVRSNLFDERISRKRTGPTTESMRKGEMKDHGK